MAVLVESFQATCWKCAQDFDALGEPWCSHDPRRATKVCPHCGNCFCEAGDKYQQDFWRSAPRTLLEELELLSRSNEPLGEELVRRGALTTSELLGALVRLHGTGHRLSDVLREEGKVSGETLSEAIRSVVGARLSDTGGKEYPTIVCESDDPKAVLQYLLSVGARRGASEIHLEPLDSGVALKYRIDEFTFHLEPLPGQLQGAFLEHVFRVFRLDPGRARRPQRGRTRRSLPDGEFDLLAQTLPTPFGPSVTIRLLNRATYIRDFASLGLETDDRLRLLEELRRPFGLVLITAPAFDGGHTTLYSIMDFLVRARRQVVSIESPVQWIVEGARQVEVAEDGSGDALREALRAVFAVRPDVLVLFSVPDVGTAQLAVQLASSALVVGFVPALSASSGVASLLELGVPPQRLAEALCAATSQRLLRRVCEICRQPAPAPTPETLSEHGLGPADAEGLDFQRGRGCPSCQRMGYRGQRAVFEVLTGGPELARGISQGLSAAELELLAKGDGMTDLRGRALACVRSGLTSFEEFARLRF